MLRYTTPRQLRAPVTILAAAAALNLLFTSGGAANGTEVSSLGTGENTDISFVTPKPLGSNPLDRLQCTAIDAQQWVQTPPNIDVPRVAQALNVNASRVTAGRAGAAVCESAVSSTAFYDQSAVVDGIGSLCLVTGFSDATVPVSASSNKITADCAADVTLPLRSPIGATFPH